MFDIIIACAITFFVTILIVYAFLKLKQKKHWSQGYMVLGKNSEPRQRAQEPVQTNNSDSMFPPGWG
ncbi:MAG: hypothetical protein PHC66_03155 [Candidatus Nanoarchaeia archaeon]|nr:hypothetical protein [Candidatus Nanoarchaeia archaeon]MDD5239432.1 hypothetical protein [Candidatus Nanoarchaeia archaeon]